MSDGAVFTKQSLDAYYVLLRVARRAKATETDAKKRKDAYAALKDATKVLLAALQS